MKHHGGMLIYRHKFRVNVHACTTEGLLGKKTSLSYRCIRFIQSRICMLKLIKSYLILLTVTNTVSKVFPLVVFFLRIKLHKPAFWLYFCLKSVSSLCPFAVVHHVVCGKAFKRYIVHSLVSTRNL